MCHEPAHREAGEIDPVGVDQIGVEHLLKQIVDDRGLTAGVPGSSRLCLGRDHHEIEILGLVPQGEDGGQTEAGDETRVVVLVAAPVQEVDEGIASVPVIPVAIGQPDHVTHLLAGGMLEGPLEMLFGEDLLGGSARHERRRQNDARRDEPHGLERLRRPTGRCLSGELGLWLLLELFVDVDVDLLVVETDQPEEPI